MGFKSIWIGGWATSIEVFAPWMNQVLTKSPALFLDVHDLIKENELQDDLLEQYFDQCDSDAPVFAWSLGSLAVLKLLSRRKTPLTNPVVLFCPIFDFCGKESPWSERVVQRMINRLKVDKTAVLTEFWELMKGSTPLITETVDAEIQNAWLNAAKNYSPENLVTGLNALSKWKVDASALFHEGRNLTFMGDSSDRISPLHRDLLARQLPQAQIWVTSSGHFPFLRSQNDLAQMTELPQINQSAMQKSFQIKRFNRAAKTYDSHSQIQRSLAEALLALYRRQKEPSQILELGCGTGYLTKLLWSRFSKSEIIATDGAPAMVAATSSRLQLLVDVVHPSQGTAELIQNANSRTRLFRCSELNALKPTLEDVGLARQIEMVASNALVQWFSDLPTHFQAVQNLLLPGGSYLVSGFLDDNLPELRSVLQGPPFFKKTLPGHNVEQIQSAAEDAGFVIKAWSGLDDVVVYPNAHEMLKAFSGLGATLTPTEMPLTRTLLNQFTSTYQQQYRKGDGVRATWCAWAAWLIRK